MLPIHLFPKFAAHLSATQLADWCREVNVDGVDVLVRQKYWVEPNRMHESLGPFCTCMRAAGLQVYTASVPFTPDELLVDETPLRVLADNGIKLARLGYVQPSPIGSLRSQLSDLRLKLAALAQVCLRCGIRGVIQMHGGTIHQSASALYWLLQDIPTAALGVMADPGNMRAQEGYERWEYVVNLLGEYIALVGVKDVAWYRDEIRGSEDGKGWRSSWVTLDSGMVNWVDTIRCLDTAGLQVPLQLAPFYATHQFAVHTEWLQKDVLYLREVLSGSRFSDEKGA